MTTRRVNWRYNIKLWFAQNSLPLWLKWQLKIFCCCFQYCCDLLKIHYLCGWNDNLFVFASLTWPVVICSKFITFVVEMTTLVCQQALKHWLWFAQNSLPLWLKWQPKGKWTSEDESCDLLKIHYLCGWNDNPEQKIRTYPWVVICSKFITFVVEMTTQKVCNLEC